MKRKPTTRKKPASSRPLRLKQRRFVSEYLKDLNGAAAARRAGYSANSAKVIASENLTKPDVRRAVQEKVARQLASADITTEDVLRAIARHVRAAGQSDIRDLYRRARLAEMWELDENAAVLVSGVDVVRGNLDKGDGRFDDVVKVKLADQVPWVELAAKYKKLLTDVVEVHDVEARHARLDAGRLRAAQAKND